MNNQALEGKPAISRLAAFRLRYLAAASSHSSLLLWIPRSLNAVSEPYSDLDASSKVVVFRSIRVHVAYPDLIHLVLKSLTSSIANRYSTH